MRRKRGTYLNDRAELHARSQDDRELVAFDEVFANLIIVLDFNGGEVAFVPCGEVGEVEDLYICCWSALGFWLIGTANFWGVSVPLVARALATLRSPLRLALRGRPSCSIGRNDMMKWQVVGLLKMANLMAWNLVLLLVLDYQSSVMLMAICFNGDERYSLYILYLGSPSYIN